MRSRILLSLASVLVLKTGEATSHPRASQPTVNAPAGSIVGFTEGGVEYFRGIPYAEPPIGNLRLKPPVRLSTQDSINATGVAPACIQFNKAIITPLFLEAISQPGVADILFLGTRADNPSEDCLILSVMRPSNISPDAKLPVLYWIHGGAFKVGSSQPFDGSVLIPRALRQGKPFILVTVNYRLGGFGFLPGSELQAEGSTNLGLMDQRIGLQWVADNIAAFGGDPNAVTIAGESAGSISVLSHMAMYDGDNNYRGRPLFRAAIMNSGNVLPLKSVNSTRFQAIFDEVVDLAGCSNNTDALNCLRALSVDDFQAATQNVASFNNDSSLELNYMPRPDGRTLTNSPTILAAQGKLTRVPMIIGDLQNEGTFFATFSTPSSTRSDLIAYLKQAMFKDATQGQLGALADTYAANQSSPNNPYPQFERLAGILGDSYFTLTRRFLLEHWPITVPAWSWIGDWNPDLSILKSFHASDVPRMFYGTDPSSQSLQDRYIAFVHSLDPNIGLPHAQSGFNNHWPAWKVGRYLLQFGQNETSLSKDNFRQASYEVLKSNIEAFAT